MVSIEDVVAGYWHPGRSGSFVGEELLPRFLLWPLTTPSAVALNQWVKYATPQCISALRQGVQKECGEMEYGAVPARRDQFAASQSAKRVLARIAPSRVTRLSPWTRVPK